ncbi:MAG: lauroyl/myristoyl acyltransferase, partial [Candidatus Azotimanducaceae bacterium]
MSSFLVKILLNLASLLPLSWARAIGTCIAWFHCVLKSRSFLVAEANVQLCFADLSAG